MKKLFAVFAVFGLLLAACGDDGDDTLAATSEEVAPDTGEAEVSEAHPVAIISMSATATEMLFAIGAGDQVIAVDSFSYFPAEAPVTDLSAFDISPEAIAAYEPDLVVLSGPAGQEELESLGIPVLVQGAAVVFDDVYAQIAELGALTGQVDGAADLVASMRSDIEEIVASIPASDDERTYYHELDDTLYSVTSATFIGEVYKLAGLRNIADPADADGASFGYPQLSQEFILDADPDFIFLADTQCCGQTADVIAERDGWSDLSAVQNGNVVEVDADVASRWGPRVVDYLRVVVDSLSAASVS
ncbi:MAG: iron complex transport system substrate-binding protein [Candidatus Poriferisodalaceae bacterium]|jgi:iron complex transport system substrate-binding protein